MLLHMRSVLIWSVCRLSATFCIVTQRYKIGLQCVEVEQECGVEILIGTIFNPLGPR